MKLLLEKALGIVLVLAVLKLLFTTYLFLQFRIYDFKDPFDFWLWDSSCFGMARDCLIVFVVFKLRAKMIADRQRIPREQGIW